MPEPQRLPTRAPTPDEEALHAWFEKQQADRSAPLDEAARQIISLVTALYGVIFGIMAFAGDPVPAYLERASVQGLGLVAVLAYLVALLAALVVVIPRAHHYAAASQTQRQQVFNAILQRKAAALRIAVWAFGVASVAFAGLFVVVLFGW